MRMPRLMPLVAIAAGGVLAINAVENGPGMIGAARSFAEGVTAKPAAHAATALAADASALAPTDSSQLAAKPAPICAESPAQLAKDAGLSPAELQVIQSLGTRRGELDQREQGLDTQLALIQAAEAKVDARIATMNALKADMQGLVGQLDDKQQAEVDRLVKVYEAMKPADSAARFVLLTDEVRLPIAAKMKERVLSAMIAKMPPPEAKRLTESLAARYVAQANAARQAINPPQAAAAPPPAAPQLAQATTVPAAATPAAATPGAAAPVKPAKPAVVHHKPKKAPAPALAANKLPPTPWANGPPPASPAVKSPAAPAVKPLASAAPAVAKPQASVQAAAPKPAAPKPAAAAAATPSPAKPSTPSAAAAAPAKTG
jgi:flagellar motility protein MotE (MotC chaperone)